MEKIGFPLSREARPSSAEKRSALGTVPRGAGDRQPGSITSDARLKRAATVVAMAGDVYGHTSPAATCAGPAKVLSARPLETPSFQDRL
jgi:hypothetical protein